MLEAMLQKKKQDRVRITLFSREVAGKWDEEKKKEGGTLRWHVGKQVCEDWERAARDRRGTGSEGAPAVERGAMGRELENQV